MLDFNKKPVIAMLHLKGDLTMSMPERLKRETEAYYSNGVDAVLVENYFGNILDCEFALNFLKENYKNACYGVNILGNYRRGFELADKYDADFLQIDSVCGHLEPFSDGIYSRELKALMENYDKVQVLGGVRFKYQPIRSGRTLEEDLLLGKERCTAVVTTGDGTGQDCPTKKLKEFRSLLKDFPLIVGAGVTADTVGEKLMYSDGVIVGSWLKDGHVDFGDVNESYVREFMKNARR